MISLFQFPSSNAMFLCLVSALVCLPAAYARNNELGFSSSNHNNRKIADQSLYFKVLPPGEWRCGYIDQSGKQVIAPTFDGGKSFSEGLAAVCRNGKWGYIDRNGLTKIDFRFDDAEPFCGGLAAIRIRDRWGFIDQSGQLKIKAVYLDVGSFAEDFAIVETAERRWGFINRNGVLKIEVLSADQSGQVHNFSEGLALIHLAKESHFIDKHGLTVIAKLKDGSLPFSEGFAVASKPSGTQFLKFGFISTQGRFQIEPKYSGAGSFHEGLAVVKVESGRTFIDTKDHFISHERFDDCGDFSHGLAPVCRRRKWGFIDKTGSVRLKLKYDEARTFRNHLALVRKQNKWSFITADGHLAIRTNAGICGDFSQERALVAIPNSKKALNLVKDINEGFPVIRDQ